MKKIYKAYTREINGKAVYFIKKLTIYPEFKNLPPVLECMGMHEDFAKACDLAQVYDDWVIQDLMEELQLTRVSGKVIPIQHLQREKQSKGSNIFRLPQQWLAKLKWAHL